mmetsp:Transcript_35778/g.43193  ORF Transcript_35778/g.43193 Transcript_35778/m.43193 type:complete len:162 (+) Transcript_35778:77-562(+)|eukprot:CAMPEP_0197850706 /NCGR_PEP_ID=MMETSP1438-20131217/16141_1 /TAXON_ID=1461541 /ORGANISM="Pterosperma sp., Strain CCMP1384" /LENGTH=161 /DNA_ID=CAMNT_0043464005 /DNA_START=77 /DNA_END=562 /DNA_ORIENTATION=-
MLSLQATLRLAPGAARRPTDARRQARTGRIACNNRKCKELGLTYRSAATPARVGLRRAQVVVKAIEVSGPGGGGDFQNNLSAEVIDGMREKIKTALEADSVNIIDVNGDHQHVSIDVVSSLFEGKTSVQRQRLVYKAIWEELQSSVHAVDAMTTKTPEETK